MKGRRLETIPSLQDLAQPIRNKVGIVSRDISPEEIWNFEKIAKQFNLRLESKPLTTDGALAHPTIILNSSVTSPYRRAFTFYHELTHHLINTDDDLISQIHECVGSVDDTIERLCNIGAAEFLIPSQKVVEHIHENGLTASAVFDLARENNVSYLATAIQLVSYSPVDCYLVICQLQDAISSNAQSTLNLDFTVSSSKELAIVHSFKSPKAKYSIARYTPIAKNHPIAQVYSSKKRFEGRALMPFRSQRQWEVNCDAVYIQDSVYAIFFEELPVSKYQLRLFEF